VVRDVLVIMTSLHRVIYVTRCLIYRYTLSLAIGRGSKYLAQTFIIKYALEDKYLIYLFI